MKTPDWHQRVLLLTRDEQVQTVVAAGSFDEYSNLLVALWLLLQFFKRATKENRSCGTFSQYWIVGDSADYFGQVILPGPGTTT